MKTLAIVFAVVAIGYLGFVAGKSHPSKVNTAAPSPVPTHTAAAEATAQAPTPQPLSEDEASKERARTIEAEVANSRATARLKGRIIQVIKNDLLVDCSMPSAPAVSSLGRIGGNFGGASVPIDENDQNRPDDAYGIFLVVSHPGADTKVDGDEIDVDAKVAGRFKYAGVGGVAKTVKRYEVVRAVK